MRYEEIQIIWLILTCFQRNKEEYTVIVICFFPCLSRTTFVCLPPLFYMCFDQDSGNNILDVSKQWL